MAAKIFPIEAREDGGARVALNCKHTDRSGIQRISCDLPQAGLLQLEASKNGAFCRLI